MGSERAPAYCAYFAPSATIRARISAPSISRGATPCLSAIAAPMPAASPDERADCCTRTLASAANSAPRQRPATIRLSKPLTVRQRYGISYHGLPSSVTLSNSVLLSISPWTSIG